MNNFLIFLVFVPIVGIIIEHGYLALYYFTVHDIIGTIKYTASIGTLFTGLTYVIEKELMLFTNNDIILTGLFILTIICLFVYFIAILLQIYRGDQYIRR